MRHIWAWGNVRCMVTLSVLELPVYREIILQHVSITFLCCHKKLNTMSNAALSSYESVSSHDDIIINSASLMTIDVSAEDKVNMISDDHSEHCNPFDSVMELTPYPYMPTPEELADYYQLEQSLGEDWSYRLACELSFDVVSMDDDDDSNNNDDDADSVTFLNHPHTEATTFVSFPEDVEVRTYTRRDNYFEFDDLVTPIK